MLAARASPSTFASEAKMRYRRWLPDGNWQIAPGLSDR
jgi:hypothetical protein